MLAALSWIPKGAAKSVPVEAEPNAEELQAILQAEGQENIDASADIDEDENFEDADEEERAESSKRNDSVRRAVQAARALGTSFGKNGLDELSEGLAELDMDHYDDEDGAIDLFGNGGLGSTFYASNKDDPYLLDKDDDDDDEIEDLTLKPTDLLIVTARNEDDVSLIEVWVYEAGTDNDPETNLYVHHDIMLPAFPLSLAWMNFNVANGDEGNFVAVGTMLPQIEIWDLDVLDEVEPAAVLGGQVDAKSKKKKKKKKEMKLKEGSHTDAVLGLSWNPEYRNVLASASADTSVKIWDIAVQKCAHTLQIHNDKVQAVAWNQNDKMILLSGSFDHTVAVADMRTPSLGAPRWSVSADVESVAWNPHSSYQFLVSLDNGLVTCHDSRKGALSSQAPATDSVYTIHAHDKAVCSISYNLSVKNLLATASSDKTVKLWDTTGNQPSCIVTTNPKVGAIFTSAFCQSSPFLLALGGSKGTLQIWDTLENSEVRQRFGKAAHSQ